MPNPFNMMNNMGGNTNLPQINQDMTNLLNMMKTSGNPMQMLQIVAMQNPQLQPIVKKLQNGQTPEQIVKEECQRKGIDLNALINQYGSYGSFFR